MDLKKHHNLFSLWGYSFVMMVRVWWRIIVISFVFAIVARLFTAVARGAIETVIGTLFFTGAAGNPQSLKMVLIMFLVAFLVGTLVSCYFIAVVMHLFAQVLNDTKISLMEAISNAFGSFFSLFVVSLPIWFFMTLGTFFFHNHPLLRAVVFLLLFLLVFIRWTYACGYIIFQEQGIKDSISSSWDLTRRRYGETFVTWVLIVIYALCSFILMVIALKIIRQFVYHPASIEEWRSAMELPVSTAVCFIWSQPIAFILAMFTNRENVENPRATRQELEDWTPPELEAQELNLSDSELETNPQSVSKPNTPPANPGHMDVIE